MLKKYNRIVKPAVVYYMYILVKLQILSEFI